MREPKDVVVLVVDDEDALRQAIVFDFNRKGFQVLEASSGNKALEIVKKTKVDIVLTDVRMPDGSGVDLLNQLRQLNPGLPVVMFITGFADLTLEDAYDKGADAVFSKPFDRKALMASVMKAVASNDEKWSARKFDRVESSFVVNLRCPSIGTAMQGNMLNLGRGGMFVALKEPLPPTETKVFFEISLQDRNIPAIEGSGTVRWARIHSSVHFPTGCGIEFEHLEDHSRAHVIELINDLKTYKFIPKN